MKRISDSALTLLLCSAVFILTAFSSEAKEGAINGINLCERTIIPSLLPILIICSIITKSRCSLVIEKVFGWFFEAVFSLPGICSSAVISGLTGGFPAGAVLTRSLYRDGLITASDARRIMTFNFCGGAAFIIIAVGSGVYGNTKVGLMLYIINIISSLITAFFTRFLFPVAEQKSCTRNFHSFYDALTYGVEDCVKALAVMSAYIVLFSAFFSVLKIPQNTAPLFEITNGVCGGNAPLPLPFCAFFLSFGGLCIHLQLLGCLKEMNVKLSVFFTGRLFCAVSSYFITKLYVFLFPESVEVFSNISSPTAATGEGGIALSLIMIIGCAVVIFDIENRKIKLHNTL